MLKGDEYQKIKIKEREWGGDRECSIRFKMLDFLSSEGITAMMTFY